MVQIFTTEGLKEAEAYEAGTATEEKGLSCQGKQ